MPPITLTDPSPTVGIPASGADTITNFDPLITGDTPAIVTSVESFGASTTIAAFSVVGRNSSGNLVMAQADGDPQARFITMVPIASPSSGAGSTGTIAVYQEGCFNPDRLVWDASFDTDVKKNRAFEAAGGNIVLKRPKTADA